MSDHLPLSPSTNNPDLLLQPFNGSVPSDLPPLADEALKLHLSDILIPLAMTWTQASIVKGSYLVQFSPEISQGINNGTYQLMESANGFRATAVNSQGRIVEQGIIIPNQGAQIFTAVSAVWQVLAIITAQYYLADIQQHLITIEQGVSQIQSWLEADDKGELIANLRVLEEIEHSLQNDISSERRERLIHQVKDSYRDLDKLAESYRLKIKVKLEPFQALQLTALNKDSHRREFIQSVRKLEELITLALFSLALKLHAIELLVRLEGYSTFQQQRVQEIRQEVLFYWQNFDYVNKVIDHKMTKAMPWSQIKKDHYETIRREMLSSKSRLNRQIDQINQLAQTLDTQLSDLQRLSQQGVKVLVTIADDGSIKQIYNANALPAIPVPA